MQQGIIGLNNLKRTKVFKIKFLYLGINLKLRLWKKNFNSYVCGRVQ